jgi:hypothetical protein
MKKIILLFIGVLFFNATQAQAPTDQQYSFHLGAFGGLSVYQGDLVDNPAEQISEAHPSFGTFLRLKYGKYFSTKLSATYGKVSGSDRNSDEVWRIKRNLRFSSPVVEVALIPEFNIYDIILPKSGYIITPYVYAGIGGFWFNPQTQYNGEWVDLQPLGTEGQGLPGNEDLYKRVAMAVPAGLGIKFQISPYSTLTWETGTRWTNTDYLDDVHHLYPDFEALREARGQIAVDLSDRSTEDTPQIPSTIQPGQERSNGKVNDFYLFSGFSFSISLSPKAEQ